MTHYLIDKSKGCSSMLENFPNIGVLYCVWKWKHGNNDESGCTFLRSWST